jgi:hypothetical protein
MRKTSRIAASAIAAAVALALGSARASVTSPVLQPSLFAPSVATGTLDRAGLRRLARADWRVYRSSGAGATVSVSPAYSDPAEIAQRWSGFFESLLHGPELDVLYAYIAPLDEVQRLCGGSPDVLGCYGADHLVMPDQEADGIAATSIATHEYGHHVAFNRINPPWTALDWGPKRWATYERVCARAAVGTAYPGAEDANYPLNPGEAWAETYRVLNETAVGLPQTWPIVDPSFRPDAGALTAAREDVLDPWMAPTVTVKRLNFAARGHTWSLQVAARLDGFIHANVQPGTDDVKLFAADGRTLVASGSWGSSGTKAFDYEVCGQHTFVLRLTRHAAARRFTLTLSTP